jgi:hypothetical protein
MSAPVLVWPDLKAELFTMKGSITGKPYFCLKLRGVGEHPVYLDMPEYQYSRHPCPESMFQELVLRINRGGK